MSPDAAISTMAAQHLFAILLADFQSVTSIYTVNSDVFAMLKKSTSVVKCLRSSVMTSHPSRALIGCGGPERGSYWLRGSRGTHSNCALFSCVLSRSPAAGMRCSSCRISECSAPSREQVSSPSLSCLHISLIARRNCLF